MPRRPPEVREAQRTEALSRWLQGETQEAIARELGVHQTCVGDDIAAALEEFRRERAADRDRMLGERLAELYLLKAEAWQAWQRSKREAVTTETVRLEAVGDVGGEGWTRAKVRREQRDGDPAFLGKVLEASREIASLVGLYPSQKVEASVAVSRPTWTQVLREVAGDAPAAAEDDDAGQAT